MPSRAEPQVDRRERASNKNKNKIKGEYFAAELGYSRYYYVLGVSFFRIGFFSPRLPVCSYVDGRAQAGKVR
jgi:hypothetical protein